MAYQCAASCRCQGARGSGRAGRTAGNRAAPRIPPRRPWTILTTKPAQALGEARTPSVTATGAIIANSTQGPTCFGKRIHELFGFNLDSGATCRLAQPTDLCGADPLLAKLASNGGPAHTQALQPASPAIGHVGTSANGCLPTDPARHHPPARTRPFGTVRTTALSHFRWWLDVLMRHDQS